MTRDELVNLIDALLKQHLKDARTRGGVLVISDGDSVTVAQKGGDALAVTVAEVARELFQ